MPLWGWVLKKSKCVIANWFHPRNPVISSTIPPHIELHASFHSYQCTVHNALHTHTHMVTIVLESSSLEGEDKWKVFFHRRLLDCVRSLNIHFPSKRCFSHACYVNESFHQRKGHHFNKSKNKYLGKRMTLIVFILKKKHLALQVFELDVSLQL